MFIEEWWFYFGIVIALVVVWNMLTGVLQRLKPKKYERPPEFSWDELDGGENPPSGDRGNKA